jgi:hypothetical protein
MAAGLGKRAGCPPSIREGTMSDKKKYTCTIVAKKKDGTVVETVVVERADLFEFYDASDDERRRLYGKYPDCSVTG